MVIKVKNNGEWVKIPYLSSDNNPIIPEAPLDGKQYARQSGEWTVVNIPEVDFTEIDQKISQNTAAIASNTTAIQSKVDKVDGFGLSSNDFTSQEKTKLAGLSNYTLPTASDTVKGGIKVGSGLTMNGEVLSATGGGMADSVEWDNVLSKPEFATVATSGAYNDLSGKPSLSTVATSGSYNDLSNKPTIPTVDVTKSYVDTQLATKANASNVYTKAEVDSKVSSVYRVKGSVASYANLPTTVDLSGYATTAAMNTALGNKVDKVSGKGLSTNDYTTAEKDKLAGIATGANNYSLPVATASVLGGVKTSTGITNSSGTISVAYGSAAGTACQGNDSRLSNSRPASDVSAWAKASTKPTYTWTEITSKPSWIGSSKPTYTASEVGALASGGTAVNASKVANSFIFKVAGGSTEGTNLYTFNGSAAKTINVVAGSNVTLTPTSGQLSISAKDTTYGIASASANGLMSSTVYNNLNTQLYVYGYFGQSQAPDYYTIDYKFINPITGEIKYNNKIELRFADTTYSGIMSPVDKRKLDSCPTGSGITEIRSITQSEYDALSTKVATTLYIITG